MSGKRRSNGAPGESLSNPDGQLPRELEEVLEALWTAHERGTTRLEDLVRIAEVELTGELVAELKARALVGEGEDEALVLTEAGRKRARRIIRRHRLAERLMHDVLAMPMTEVEANVCEFEHLVAEGITESICTLLGHPAQCPHGRPIPEGGCCVEARRSIESVLVSVDQMRIGEVARVAYVSTKSYPRLHKLAAFGVSPGVRVKLHQRSPAFVLECEETQLAIEKALAEEIYVFRTQKG